MEKDFLSFEPNKKPSSFERIKSLSGRYLALAVTLGILGTAIAKMSEKNKPLPVPQPDIVLTNKPEVKPVVQKNAPEQKKQNIEVFDEQILRKKLRDELSQKNSEELMAILSVINDKVSSKLMTKKVARIYLEEIKLRLQELGRADTPAESKVTREEVVQEEGYTNLTREEKKGNARIYTRARIQTKN